MKQACLVLCLWVVACGSPPLILLPDGGPVDAAPRIDAPLPDAGTDAGTPPFTATITEAGELHVVRLSHTATLLPNGHVLLIGGEDLTRTWTTSIEELDPTTNTWTAVADLPVARANHSAILLPDGRILIAGGGASSDNGLPSGQDVLNTTVFYDPETHAFEPGPDLMHARGHHAATLLADGSVLLVGGAGAGTASFVPLDSAERLAVGATTWTAAGTLAAPRAMAKLIADANNRLLVIGGLGMSSQPAEVEQFQDDAFTPAGMLAGRGRLYHGVARTAAGDLIVAGGICNSGFVGDVDLLTHDQTEFQAIEPLPTPRNSVALATTPMGVFAIGGYLYSSASGSQPLADIQVYDETQQRFATIGQLSAGRAGHTVTVLPSGDVIVAGGYGSFAELAIALRVSLSAAR